MCLNQQHSFIYYTHSSTSHTFQFHTRKAIVKYKLKFKGLYNKLPKIKGLFNYKLKKILQKHVSTVQQKVLSIMLMLITQCKKTLLLILL